MSDHERSVAGNKKRKWEGARVQHGSRAKKGDLGRVEWSRQTRDRRAEHDDKRQRANDGEHAPALPKPFPVEEVAGEERRPKHKVAVMIGYSGTGYKGLQINTHEKTIEGDLFAAFIAAGAISKANADDPKKSQLVRCARTDKGVHAAGNVISLKLITEDKDIVQKINAALSPQVRVWGIERTVNSFSAYQACDSRWYEYLIPTHSFIPPHPSSWLARQLGELAGQVGDDKGYEERQQEVSKFWIETEDKYIKPIVDELPGHIRAEIQAALYSSDTDSKVLDSAPGKAAEVPTRVEEAQQDSMSNEDDPAQNCVSKPPSSSTAALKDGEFAESSTREESTPKPATSTPATSTEATSKYDSIIADRKALEAAPKSLRNAYRTAKRAYRIPSARLARIQPILDHFLGTRNFHNYTIEKKFRDPSAKRLIKSFKFNDQPILIDGTEWLSFKIHGQSFMMHQIRKMIGMIALIIRCGCDPDRINDSFQESKLNIPKAPALGLLLERPVFDTYNSGVARKNDRPHIMFTPYEKEMGEFKQREIYERIYREENEENSYHQYFAHIDNYEEAAFLFLSSKGVDAIRNFEARSEKATAVKRLEESEDEALEGREEG